MVHSATAHEDANGNWTINLADPISVYLNNYLTSTPATNTSFQLDNISQIVNQALGTGVEPSKEPEEEDEVIMQLDTVDEEEIIIDNLYSGSFTREEDTGVLVMKFKMDEKFLKIVTKHLLKYRKFSTNDQGKEFNYYVSDAYEDVLGSACGESFFYDPYRPPIVNSSINLGLIFNTLATSEEGATYNCTGMMSVEMIEYYQKVINKVITYIYQSLIAPVQIEFNAKVITQEE